MNSPEIPINELTISTLADNDITWASAARGTTRSCRIEHRISGVAAESQDLVTAALKFGVLWAEKHLEQRPEVPQCVEPEIPMSELRISTYSPVTRSGFPCKPDSGCAISHPGTGIEVRTTDERSIHKARAAAMQEFQRQWTEFHQKPKGPVQHSIEYIARQPVVDGRFKKNEIVDFLLLHGGHSMNSLATMEFSDADRAQFAQLIGYSVSGWGTLSYVSDADYHAVTEDLKTTTAAYRHVGNVQVYATPGGGTPYTSAAWTEEVPPHGALLYVQTAPGATK